MKKLDRKLKVGILGGTGMVGQRFITLLENHPWFEVTTIAASSHSAGKTYEESMAGRWKLQTPMPEAVKKIVVQDVSDVENVAKDVDFVFSAVNMSKDEIRAIEEEYAKTETPVVSNNSAHRWTKDVPMVMRVPMMILAAGCILTGIFPGSFETVEQTLYPIYGTIGFFYRFF